MTCLAACGTVDVHICLLLVSPGFVEEGLLLEDVVQTPATEKPPAEEVPAEIPSPELPDIITLPEPPLEVEASGSGDLEELLKPAAPTEADVSFEHMEPHDGLVPGDDAIKAAAVLEAGEAEAVDLTNEAGEPTSKTSSAPAEESSEEDSNFSAVAPTDKVDNAEQPVGDPGEEANAEVVSTNPDVAVLEEDGAEAAAESGGQEVMEETLPEAPAVETEGPEAPQILTEDLAEDEILLVNGGETGPARVDESRAQPTVLSPERESPFTRVSDMNPVTQEHPHVNVPSLVEVMLFTPGEGNGKQRFSMAFVPSQSWSLVI